MLPARFSANAARSSGVFSRSRRSRAGGVCRKSDRKSTRLNSSHTVISYAVFCLKKKKKITKTHSYGTLLSYILAQQDDLTSRGDFCAMTNFHATLPRAEHSTWSHKTISHNNQAY